MKTTPENATAPQKADLAIEIFSPAFFSSLFPFWTLWTINIESATRLSICAFWVARFVASWVCREDISMSDFSADLRREWLTSCGTKKGC